MRTITNILCLLVLSLQTIVLKAQLTENLLVNPGGESGTLIGWTPGGAVTPLVVSTNTIPSSHDDGFVPNTGWFFFTGGRDASGYLLQTVNIAGVGGITTNQIDSGFLEANFAFKEMSLDQGLLTDTVKLSLIFTDEAGQQINVVSSSEIASRNPLHPANPLWTNFQGKASVPKGTRTIGYKLDFILNSGSGSDTDSFVDDNVLTLSDSRQAEVESVLSIFPAVEVSWPSVLGKTYQLQRASGAGKNWIDFGLPISGTGAPMDIFDRAIQPSSIYRLISR